MIRKAKEKDLDQIWEIFHSVIQTEDTYVFYADTPKSDLRKHWFSSHIHTYVFEEKKQILGMYIVKPNQIDLGNHIANASYMVSPNAQGKGIGKKLCEHSLEQAKRLGFRAMQFNVVVSTNTRAVELWEKFGFETIGTTPKGFRHPKLGFVDTHIMHKKL